jgi:hypothetical protein
MQNFQECVSIILSRWTAIKLINDLDLGGDRNSTKTKINALKESVFNFFVDYGVQVDAFDLADNLTDYLSEEFDVALEDNSSIQVSMSLIEYYKQVHVNGQVQALENLRKLPNASNYKCESSDDSSIESLIESMDIDVSDKNAPIVDEEGFTLVTRKKR